MHKCKTNFRKRISEIKVEILLMKKKIYIHCAESQFGENYITKLYCIGVGPIFDYAQLRTKAYRFSLNPYVIPFFVLHAFI